MVPPTYLSPAGSGRLLYAAGHKMKERKLQMGITHAAGKRCVACWGPHAHTSPGEASLDCMIREAVRARASARINNVVRTTILIAAFQGGKQSARQSSEERRLTLLHPDQVSIIDQKYARLPGVRVRRNNLRRRFMKLMAELTTAAPRGSFRALPEV